MRRFSLRVYWNKRYQYLLWYMRLFKWSGLALLIKVIHKKFPVHLSTIYPILALTLWWLNGARWPSEFFRRSAPEKYWCWGDLPVYQFILFLGTLGGTLNLPGLRFLKRNSARLKLIVSLFHFDAILTCIKVWFLKALLAAKATTSHRMLTGDK